MIVRQTKLCNHLSEIEKWFRDANLKDIKSYEHPEAGITCVGIYE